MNYRDEIIEWLKENDVHTEEIRNCMSKIEELQKKIDMNNGKVRVIMGMSNQEIIK